MGFSYYVGGFLVGMTGFFMPLYGISSDDQTYGTLICKEVTSVYDGDTFRCTIEDVHPLIGNRIAIRINGIDTPEMTDSRPQIKEIARTAKQFAAERLRAARKVELRNVKRDKYFRIVADVYVDGQNLGGMMLKKTLAKPYNGGKKTW